MRFRLNGFVGVLLITLLGACQAPAVDHGGHTVKPPMAKPPLAKQVPTSREYHGRILQDDYFWLRDPSYPEVDDPDILAYLEAENSWFEQQMAPLQPAVDTLFEEMKGRLEEDLEAVPWEDGDYIYRWRYLEGSEYRLWERRPKAGGEFVAILDESLEAGGHDYFQITALEVSPDGRRLAWAADFNGSERSTIYVDDLDTGRRYDDGLAATRDSLVWGADNSTLFYAPLEEEGWYSLRVKAHTVGSPPAGDREVFYEPDRSLELSVSRSQSRQYLFIALGNHQSSEIHIVPLERPNSEPLLVAPRRDGHYYELDHRDGLFYIRTNDDHVNFRIATAPEQSPGPAHWTTLLPSSDAVYYQNFVLLENFIAVEEMSEGQKRIRILENSGRQYHVRFPEKLYSASLGNNPQLASDVLRINYQSMVTPTSVYDSSPACTSPSGFGHRPGTAPWCRFPWSTTGIHRAIALPRCSSTALAPMVRVWSRGFPPTACRW